MTDKLNDNDKQRIEQEIDRINKDKLYVMQMSAVEKAYFRLGAEYATIYERQQQEQLEADIKARNIFIENLEIYNQELISKLQSKCPDEELIKGYTNKIVEVAELKKEIRDTTDIYEKERAYLRELANKKTDESERYAKLAHSNNDKLKQLEAERSELIGRIEKLENAISDTLYQWKQGDGLTGMMITKLKLTLNKKA